MKNLLSTLNRLSYRDVIAPLHASQPRLFSVCRKSGFLYQAGHGLLWLLGLSGVYVVIAYAIVYPALLMLVMGVLGSAVFLVPDPEERLIRHFSDPTHLSQFFVAIKERAHLMHYDGVSDFEACKQALKEKNHKQFKDRLFIALGHIEIYENYAENYADRITEHSHPSLSELNYLYHK